MLFIPKFPIVFKRIWVPWHFSHIQLQQVNNIYLIYYITYAKVSIQKKLKSSEKMANPQEAQTDLEKKNVLVLLKLDMNGNGICHTTDAPNAWMELNFQMLTNTIYDPWGQANPNHSPWFGLNSVLVMVTSWSRVTACPSTCVSSQTAIHC